VTDRYDDLLEKARAAHESGVDMDAQGWEAVVRGVHAERAQYRSPVARGWVPAALVALALGWALLPKDPVDTEHAMLLTAQERSVYQEGDRVETHSQPEAFVAFGGTRVLAGPNTQLSLGEWTAEHMEITLHRGHLSADVALEIPGARFEVIAAGHRVRVIGTTFSVDVTDTNALAVMVQHGEVSIIDDKGVSRRVLRGQTFHKGTGPNADAGTPPPVPAKPAVTPQPSPRQEGSRRRRSKEEGHAKTQKGSATGDGLREILIEVPPAALAVPVGEGGLPPKSGDVRLIDIQVPAQFMDRPGTPTAPLTGDEQLP